MSPLAVSQFLYPRIYPLTGLSAAQQPQQQADGAQQNGQQQQAVPTLELELPPTIRASFEYFSTEEAYLIENGLVAFIWCGAGVPNDWLQCVSNVVSVAHLDTEKVWELFKN